MEYRTEVASLSRRIYQTILEVWENEMGDQPEKEVVVALTERVTDSIKQRLRQEFSVTNDEAPFSIFDSDEYNQTIVFYISKIIKSEYTLLDPTGKYMSERVSYKLCDIERQISWISEKYAGRIGEIIKRALIECLEIWDVIMAPYTDDEIRFLLSNEIVLSCLKIDLRKFWFPPSRSPNLQTSRLE